MSAQLATVFQAPRPPKGEHEITLHPEWANDEPVVCHYEYTRGQRRTFEQSLCYPLAINNLVTRAMNNAVLIGSPKVDAALIKAAMRSDSYA